MGTSISTICTDWEGRYTEIRHELNDMQKKCAKLQSINVKNEEIIRTVQESESMWQKQFQDRQEYLKTVFDDPSLIENVFSQVNRPDLDDDFERAYIKDIVNILKPLITDIEQD